ncbi:MAG: hypothetical protein ACUVQ0_06200 [Thermoproteota archaeon]
MENRCYSRRRTPMDPRITEKTREVTREHGLDVLVIRHYHRPFIRRENNVLYVCPGSPVDPPPPLVMKPTIGLLIVTGSKVKPIIVKVK